MPRSTGLPGCVFDLPSLQAMMRAVLGCKSLHTLRASGSLVYVRVSSIHDDKLPPAAGCNIDDIAAATFGALLLDTTTLNTLDISGESMIWRRACGTRGSGAERDVVTCVVDRQRVRQQRRISHRAGPPSQQETSMAQSFWCVVVLDFPSALAGVVTVGRVVAGNRVGDEGVYALAAALRLNRDLFQLNLDSALLLAVQWEWLPCHVLCCAVLCRQSHR